MMVFTFEFLRTQCQRSKENANADVTCNSTLNHFLCIFLAKQDYKDIKDLEHDTLKDTKVSLCLP